MDWSMNLPSLVRIHKILSHRFNLPFISDSHLSKRIIHTIKDFFSKYFQFFSFFLQYVRLFHRAIRIDLRFVYFTQMSNYQLCQHKM